VQDNQFLFGLKKFARILLLCFLPASILLFCRFAAALFSFLSQEGYVANLAQPAIKNFPESTPG